MNKVAIQRSKQQRAKTAGELVIKQTFESILHNSTTAHAKVAVFEGKGWLRPSCDEYQGRTPQEEGGVNTKDFDRAERIVPLLLYPHGAPRLVVLYSNKNSTQSVLHHTTQPPPWRCLHTS